MKITKFIHSCLLIETVERTALFDPGGYSSAAIDLNNLTRLDDILITHEHGDHFDIDFVRRLAAKFPKVRVTSTGPVVSQLADAGIDASSRAPVGAELFESPHESKAPLMPVAPEQVGVHFLDLLSHPGDSHSFKETKSILALPVQAPWGTSFNAAALALHLK